MYQNNDDSSKEWLDLQTRSGTEFLRQRLLEIADPRTGMFSSEALDVMIHQTFRVGKSKRTLERIRERLLKEGCATRRRKGIYCVEKPAAVAASAYLIPARPTAAAGNSVIDARMRRVGERAVGAAKLERLNVQRNELLRAVDQMHLELVVLEVYIKHLEGAPNHPNAIADGEAYRAVMARRARAKFPK